MTNRFLHTSAIVLLLLLGLVSEARSQSDSIRFLAGDSIELGTVQLGTSKIDTIYVSISGSPRKIFAAPDTAIRINSPQFPYSFLSRDTIGIEISITPRRVGADTLILVMYDTIANRSTDTLHLYLNGTQPPGFRLSRDSIDIGPVLLGGDIIDSFFVISSKDSIEITSVATPDGLKDSITVLSPLPAVITPGDSTAILFRVRPTQLGSRVFHFNVTSSTQATRTATVSFEGVGESDPDSAFAIDPERNDAFTAVIGSAADTFVIQLKNTTGSDLVIDTVTFDPSPYFKLAYLPQTVPNGGIFSVTLEVITPSTGFFRTNIRLPDNGGLASEYTLGAQVLRIASNSVPVIHSPSGMRITQSSTELAMEGLPFETGELAIYDLLGRELATHRITSQQMMLPKLDAFGARIPDGCYIIRIRDSRGLATASIKLLLLSF